VLAGITARGRLLAAYDRAAWHATDALLAARADLTGLTGSVARPLEDGWHVYYGRLTAARDTFWVAYEAIEAGAPDTFRLVQHAPVLPFVGWELRAARALQTGLSDFGTPDRMYNAYVLPAPQDRFWVYFLPGQTRSGIWPHGGDQRYLVSAQGDSIIQARRMHRAVIEFTPPPANAVAGSHAALVDDVPEDSDVFLVLWRQPPRAEVVVTQHYVYEIALDGVISYKRR
jgi:hypothetical protein